MCFGFCLRKNLCENLCETFSEKSRKSCEIAVYLEIVNWAITAIATDFNEGVKLRGNYS